MKEVVLKIKSNKKVGKDIYLIELVGDVSSIKNPGEFVEIQLDGFYLRRPISVFDYNENNLKLLYKVLGRGTSDLSTYKRGKELNVLVGLGNGFDTSKSTRPLLIGGGIGIAPLYALAKKLNEEGKDPIILYGTSKKTDLVLLDEFFALGDVIICTDDGSVGYKGNVVSYLKEHELDYDYYYSCGPQIMLKYLKEFDDNGCVSLEARMGCGFGACMGCSIETINGPKRVCKEGPVFEASEVIFE